MSDKTKTYIILFMAMACVGMANKVYELRKEAEPMRVKQFEDKIDATVEMIWFRGFFARVCATEGKRVDASARLMKLCHEAYNMANTGPLQADPEPEPAPKPEPVEYAKTTPTESFLSGGGTRGDPAEAEEAPEDKE